MKKINSVSICGISYELGSLQNIKDVLADEEGGKESLSSLAEKGLHFFSYFDGSIVDIIQRCATNSLLEADITAKEVDSVLIVTESFSGILDSSISVTNFREIRNLMFDILAEVGIINVPFFCSTFGGSSNFLQAVYLASPMIKEGCYHNLLVLCVDRIHSKNTRIMDVALALTGDGVATCIITRESRVKSPSYMIKHVGISPYLNGKYQGDWNRSVLEMYRATKNAAADCYDSLRLQPVDFDWLIQANYNALSSQVFSRLLGFNADRTFLQNVSRAGHIPSCDSLINLKDLSTLTRLLPESRLLIFLNGPISCGTIALEVQSHNPAKSKEVSQN